MEKIFETNMLSIFFLCNCVFYRPDKTDVTKSKNRCETSSVALYSLSTLGNSICQLTANFGVGHV